MNIRTQLETIGVTPDAALDPFEGALTLSAWAEPGLNLEPYRRHGQALMDGVAAYVHNDDPLCPLVGEALRQVLHRRYGYAAAPDPQEHGDGALLARVIDRRRGGAWALCVLYAHALKDLAIKAELISFAPRPLLRIEDIRGHRRVLDPFDGGRALNARQLREMTRTHRGGGGELDPFGLAPVGPRAVLVALQDAIKSHHLRHAAPEAALAALEAALLVAPSEPRLWREAGLLNARLDRIGDAISALERFLDLPGGDAHRYSASQLLQQLQIRQDRTPT